MKTASFFAVVVFFPVALVTVPAAETNAPPTKVLPAQSGKCHLM